MIHYDNLEQDTITEDGKTLHSTTAPNMTKGSARSTCDGCYFDANERCPQAPCMSTDRKDGRTVIFVAHQVTRA